MNNFYNWVHLSGFYNSRKVEKAAKKGHELFLARESEGRLPGVLIREDWAKLEREKSGF